MLTLISLALLFPQTTGLQEGESISELAPVVVSESPDLCHGRIVNAFTGMPVAGAAVETWTEEIDADKGGFFRFGKATSGVGGRFAVLSQLGKKRAEKVRVQAVGYLTRSMTLGDIDNSIVLFPAPKQAMQIRAIDAMGRAVAGALITSTYSCAHDVPAFSERTDDKGLVELPAYGLQDETPQLRVRALGFGAIKYLDGDDIFSTGQSGDPFVLRLKRRSPTAYCLLKKSGEPWAGANLMVNDGEGYHVLTTGTDGRFRVESRYGGSSCGVYLLESPEPRYVGTLPTAERVALMVRDRPEEWPEELPTGTLVLQAPEDCPTEIWASHLDGWLSEVSPNDSDGFEFPAGKGFLIAGGSFTGFAECVHVFELKAGERLVLDVELDKEPVVTVLTPEGENATLWVQGEKETLDFGGLPSGPLTVPSDESVCFVFENEGEVRRVSVNGATDGQVIDMRPDSTIIQTKPPLPVYGQKHFVIPEGSALFVSSPSQLFSLKKHSSPDGIPNETLPSLSGPIGGQYLLNLQSPGCFPTFIRGTLKDDSPGILTPLAAIPFASLQIISDQKMQVIGFDEIDLRQLTPGPLNLTLVSETGERQALQLDLEPGEQRVVRL
ncbi:MAG: hypothetical protein GY930_12925 [bacterium]|nr:hypothetical protein [bacterium]